MQHHGPRHQVEAQEHGQGQDDLQLRLRQRHAGRALLEVRQQPHRVRVDGRHGQLQGDEGQAVGCHGDAPVLGPDVVDVELPQREGGSELDLEGAGTAFCMGGAVTCTSQQWYATISPSRRRVEAVMTDLSDRE